MIDDITVAVFGIKDIADIRAHLPGVERAVARAVRDTTNFAFKDAKKEMQKQVAWPKGYLNEQRFSKSVHGRGSAVQGKISARFRATSLARFATSRSSLFSGKGPKARARELSVTVKPGRTKVVQRGFLMKLRNGNIGLAVALLPGQRETGRYEWKTKDGRTIRMLYGPSVDQVFRSVSKEDSRKYARHMNDRFVELLEKGAKGKS